MFEGKEKIRGKEEKGGKMDWEVHGDRKKTKKGKEETARWASRKPVLSLRT